MRTINPRSIHTALHRSPFMVVGFQSRRGPRTAGVVPDFDGTAMWFGSIADDFKVRSIAQHPDVSVTATIPTRFPYSPRWYRRPPSPFAAAPR